MSNLFKCKKSVAAVVMILAVATLLAACFKNPFGKKFDVSKDFVRFIDVGQGDATLIYSNGRSLLIDTGGKEARDDLFEVLNSCGIKTLDAVMISHLHVDHIGGLPELCDNYGIKNLILPEISIESEGLSSAQYAINVVAETEGEVHSAEQGMYFSVGEFEVTVLASYGDYDEVNNQSLFVMAEIDGLKFMFSGDAESKAEKRILDEGLNLKCDVFKSAHHGSTTSNTKEFLEALTPKYAAISCGAGNSYGHPHREIVARYKQMDIDFYRTDKNGDITFYVSDGKIKPKTEK